MKIIKIIVLIALFLIALALGSQNQEIVTFNYLAAKGDFHLSTLLGVVFILGFGLAVLLFAQVQLKHQIQVRKLKRQIKKLQGGKEPSQETAAPAPKLEEKQQA